MSITQNERQKKIKIITYTKDFVYPSHMVKVDGENRALKIENALPIPFDVIACVEYIND